MEVPVQVRGEVPALPVASGRRLDRQVDAFLQRAGMAESVAGRVLSVLDAFGDAPGTLRLTDIARRTGLPAPTALRMVRELVAWAGWSGRLTAPTASAPVSAPSAPPRPAPAHSSPRPCRPCAPSPPAPAATPT
ncbi:hypothetical protein SCANM63S_00244 [Streptomyces canarius]